MNEPTVRSSVATFARRVSTAIGLVCSVAALLVGTLLTSRSGCAQGNSGRGCGPCNPWSLPGASWTIQDSAAHTLFSVTDVGNTGSISNGNSTWAANYIGADSGNFAVYAGVGGSVGIQPNSATSIIFTSSGINLYSASRTFLDEFGTTLGTWTVASGKGNWAVTGTNSALEFNGGAGDTIVDSATKTGKLQSQNVTQLQWDDNGISLPNAIHCSSNGCGGSIAMFGGTNTVTLNRDGQRCVCSSESSATAAQCSVSGTTLTLNCGAGTDTVDYICF